MTNPIPAEVPPTNPYVGPVPFAEGQRLYGRDRETRALAELLIGKRIVLLISASGAGKTSLIQAALLPRLRRRLHVLPIARLRREPEPADPDTNPYVLAVLQALERGLPEEERLERTGLSHLSLAGYLGRRASAARGTPTGRHRLLVLDQMEELFTLDRLDWSAKEAFLVQLGEALGGVTDWDSEPPEDAPPPPWALLSMREDYVAELEPYLRLIPTGLGFRYRLEPLKPEAALEAATGPAGDWFPEQAARVLIEDLRTLAVPGPDGAVHSKPGRYVEPVQLQVVCQRLWQKAVTGGGRPIAPEDIRSGESGSEVTAALGAYYDEAVELATASAWAEGVRQRDLRQWIEERLIGSSRIRARVLRQEGTPIDTALAVLIERHLLREDVAGDRRFVELAHDRLVDPVLASNEAWRAANLALFQRQAKLWGEAGRTHDDMLFRGPELEGALAFAAAHPEGLSELDHAFLDRSREMQQWVEKEAQRVRQIAAKNEEIKRKNRSLRRQRTWLAWTGAGVLVALTAAVLLLIYLQGAYETIARNALRMTFAQADGMARGGTPSRALRDLVEAGEKIAASGRTDQEPELAERLVQLLGSHPPVVRRIGSHGHSVRDLAYGVDGERLYSVGRDGALIVWPLPGTDPTKDDQASDSRIVRSQAHVSDIRDLDYHAGRGLLISVDEDRVANLWSLADPGPEVVAVLGPADGSLDRRKVTAAALSPDGARLATVDDDGQVRLWDLTDPSAPRVVETLTAPGRGARGGPRLAFVPAGPYLGSLVLARGDRLLLWQAPLAPTTSPLVLPALDPADRGISALAVSPDGRWLAVGWYGGGLRAFDLAAGDATGAAIPTRHFPSRLTHRGPVFGLAFTADGKRLASAGTDETLLLWTLPDEAQTDDDFVERLGVMRFQGWGDTLYAVAFAPGSDSRVAAAVGNTIVLADLNRPNRLATQLPGSEECAPDCGPLAATPDLGLLAARGGDGLVRRWRWDGVAGAYIPLTSIAPPAPLERIALVPGGTLAGLTLAGQLLIWPQGEDGAPTESHLTYDARGGDGAMGIEDDRARRRALALAARDGMIATGVGTALRLWVPAPAPEKGWQEVQYLAVEDAIQALAFDTEGKRLAVAGDFDRVLVWKIAGNRASGERQAPNERADRVHPGVLALAFEAEGQGLVSGGDDAVLVEWDQPASMGTQALVKKSQAALHKWKVTALAAGRLGGAPAVFSSDGRGQLVVCSQSVSDATCAPVAWPVDPPIAGLALAPNGPERLVVSQDGVWVWDLRREVLMETARDLAEQCISD